MIELVSCLIYVLSIPFWCYIWHRADGFAMMRRVPLIRIPFYLALLYLAANALLVALHPQVGAAAYEESRFAFLESRSGLAVDSMASVLIIATIVYGLTTRRLPLNFVRFLVYGFIAILGVLAPVLWIPEGIPEGFPMLRHFQTVALIYGLFFCVAGIITLLNDLLMHGEVCLTLDHITDERGAGRPDTPSADGERPHDAETRPERKL